MEGPIQETVTNSVLLLNDVRKKIIFLCTLVYNILWLAMKWLLSGPMHMVAASLLISPYLFILLSVLLNLFFEDYIVRVLKMAF